MEKTSPTPDPSTDGAVGGLAALQDSQRAQAATIKKTAELQSACNEGDTLRLKALASTKGGFLTDAVRREACMCESLPIFMSSHETLTDNGLFLGTGPILLGLRPRPTLEKEEGQPSLSQGDTMDKIDWKQLPRHGDEDQVMLDVNRSFIYYPHSTISLAPSSEEVDWSMGR